MLPAHTGRLVSLQEILHLDPAVIGFNRGHWCPFCKIELKTIVSCEVNATRSNSRRCVECG
jgi:peroxiredoxin